MLGVEVSRGGGKMSCYYFLSKFASKGSRGCQRLGVTPPLVGLEPLEFNRVGCEGREREIVIIKCLPLQHPRAISIRDCLCKY